MLRIVWTQTHWPESGELIEGGGLNHSMDVPKDEVETVLAELRATSGITDVHVVTAEETTEAWRTHPARNVNGGWLTDEQLLGRVAAFEAGDLSPGDLYPPREWVEDA